MKGIDEPKKVTFPEDDDNLTPKPGAMGEKTVPAHRPAVHGRISTQVLLFNLVVQAWQTEHRPARRDHPSNANETCL